MLKKLLIPALVVVMASQVTVKATVATEAENLAVVAVVDEVTGVVVPTEEVSEGAIASLSAELEDEALEAKQVVVPVETVEDVIAKLSAVLATDEETVVEQIQAALEEAKNAGLTNGVIEAVAASIAGKNISFMTPQRKKELLILVVGIATGVVCSYAASAIYNKIK